MGNQLSHNLDIQEFLRLGVDAAVIDVRAPCEFADGHIPGALHCPLFDDEQRARVGVCYHEQGHDEAVLLGLDIVGPKMRGLIERVRELTADPAPLLHCARGGMRSASVAWLLTQAGLQPRVLTGGYKAYRRAAMDAFCSERPVVVLAGMTGAGKTVMLDQLALAGEQVLDLEKLAHHRGSSFGAIGLPSQPTSEQFQNELFTALQQLDEKRPIWVEDESALIGRVRIPEEFWSLMRRSPAIFMDIDRQQRAKNLAVEYGDLDRGELAEATERLTRKLGGPLVRELLLALERGEMESVAFQLLDYYDKTYQHAATKRPRQHVFRLSGAIDAQRLVAFRHECCDELVPPPMD